MNFNIKTIEFFLKQIVARALSSGGIIHQQGNFVRLWLALALAGLQLLPTAVSASDKNALSPYIAAPVDANAATGATRAPVASMADALLANVCFATRDNGTNVFSSPDSQAVRDAVAAASIGDTVKVAGYCSGVAVQSSYAQTVLLNKVLTLAGGYTTTNWISSLPATQPTTLDALGAGRVISASAPVALQDLIVKNGRFTDLGGGAFFHDIVTITGVTFISNSTTVYGGGAYFSATVSVANTSFISNAANSTAGGAYFNGVAIVTNATFISNTAGDHGGGAWFSNNATVIGNSFISNTAQLDGGGAFFNLIANVSDTTFTHNTSLQLEGGGAYFGANTFVTNTIFSANTALNNLSQGGGGAYFRSTSSVAGGYFISNTTVSAGGGARFHGPASVNSTSFISNTSNGGGGAYFDSTAIVDSTSFTRNVSSGRGAGAYFDDVTTITGTSFSQNTAYDSGGGAFFNRRASVTGTTFISNTATTSSGGGALFNNKASVAGTTFISNTANNIGGGVSFGDVATVIDTFFLSNTARTSYGGGAYFNNTGTISDTTFRNNVAVVSDGGGAYFIYEAAMTATTFINNTANKGGALYLLAASTNLNVIANSVFARNQASTKGNAIYMQGAAPTSMLSLVYSTLSQLAPTGHEAIHIQAGNVAITNTIMASHTVAISVAGGVVSENYNLFFGNGSNISGPVSSGGQSQNGNPKFINIATDNYHLGLGSAALSFARDLGIGTDFDGSPRPQGGGFDVGAFEAVQLPDLGIRKTSAVNTVSAGGTLTYSLFISNSGSSIATNVVLTEALPAGSTFVSGRVITPSGSSICAATGCNLGDLAIGGYATATFTITVPSVTGIITNTAGVTVSNDAIVSNNFALLTTTVTNLAPIANAGPDQSVNVSTLVTLTGVASSDPDGHTPLTYGWLQIGGPGVTLSSASAISPTFTAPVAPAVLTFTLRVTDALGLAAGTVDTVVVTVTDIAISGLSAINSGPTTLGVSTGFTASVGTGSNVVYTWIFGDGTSGSGNPASHIYAAAGVYTAIVTARNGAGGVGFSMLVTITNLAPIANAGPDQNVTTGAVVTLTGAASSDLDGHTPLTYGWLQTGGPAVILSSASAVAPIFIAPAAATVLTFRLMVTDAFGLAASVADTVLVTVTNRSPGSQPTPIPLPTLPPDEDEGNIAMQDVGAPPAAGEGDIISLVFKISLSGERAGTSVLFVDVLPLGLDFQSVEVDPLGGSCSYDSDTRRVECQVGVVFQNRPVTVTLKVRATQPGRFVNTAQAIGLDTRVIDMPGNNSVQQIIVVTPAGIGQQTGSTVRLGSGFGTFVQCSAADGCVLHWATEGAQNIVRYELVRESVGGSVLYLRAGPAIRNIAPKEVNGRASYEYIDTDVLAGRTYDYSVRGVGANGAVHVLQSQRVTVPIKLYLSLLRR